MAKFLRVLLLILGLILIIDCTLLIAADKINFGTVVPFLIGVIFIIHAVFWQKIQQILNTHKSLTKIWKALWSVFTIWLISFLVFGYSLHNSINQVDNDYANVEAIIILGGGIKDGIPTPTLASRLDTAVPLIEQQPEAIVITSGGVGIGETRSEAEAMAKYLYALHGIPLDKIYLEKKSTSTEENLLFSQVILADKNVSLNDPIALVTSDFHIPRARAIANHQGYTNINTVASPTPLVIRYNAWFREYFAYISGYLLGEY